MAATVPSDRQIALLAAKQYGHVTRTQLSRLGLSRTEIDKRIVKGLLIPVFRGVYAVGHPRPEAIARAAAAVLAGGDHAILSYFSAAALWGMTTNWPRTPEITVPARRRPSGIRVHVHPAPRKPGHPPPPRHSPDQPGPHAVRHRAKDNRSPARQSRQRGPPRQAPTPQRPRKPPNTPPAQGRHSQTQAVHRTPHRTHALGVRASLHRVRAASTTCRRRSSTRTSSALRSTSCSPTNA